MSMRIKPRDLNGNMQILLDKQFDYAACQSPFEKRWVQTARWSFSATIYSERNMKAVRNNRDILQK
jgi:hypothetical protein